MNRDHDPFRQAQYLRQCLVQDKLPLGFFFGAGCPASITVGEGSSEKSLIPDIAGLTKSVSEKMSVSKDTKAFQAACDQLKEDGVEDANVEQILSHIRSLRQVAGKGIVRGLTAAELDTLDQTICGHIVELVNKTLPNSETAFHKVARWIAAIQRTHAVEIFTTNYDLLIEQALEESRVPYFDGFVGSRRAFFDPHAMEEDLLPSRWARLWKLHGSINWCQDGAGVVYRSENVDSKQRRVIHPSHLKYDESRRMPYLAMIDQVRAFLKRPSPVLVICGYSFRDDHLNETIVQGLQGNTTSTAFCLFRGDLSKYDKAVKLARSRANLSLLAQDEAVIGLNRAPWAEKSASEGSSERIAVELLPKSSKAKEETMLSRFKLGDFSSLGAFISDVIGSDSKRESKTDAK